MTILNEVKTIIEEEVGVPFLYASLLNLNSWLDYSCLPCAACQLLEDGDFIHEGGQIKEEVDFLIFFLDKTDVRYTALENQEIIDECKARAISFMREIEKSSDIMYIDDYTYQNLYQEFDVNLTGVSLSITIKERSGEQSCEW